jgi:hypothetical protein
MWCWVMLLSDCLAGLFALQELCKLLEADVGVVLQLVQQEPGLLDVPARSLEDNIRVRHTRSGLAYSKVMIMIVISCQHTIPALTHTVLRARYGLAYILSIADSVSQHCAARAKEELISHVLCQPGLHSHLLAPSFVAAGMATFQCWDSNLSVLAWQPFSAGMATFGDMAYTQCTKINAPNSMHDTCGAAK